MQVHNGSTAHKKIKTPWAQPSPMAASGLSSLEICCALWPLGLIESVPLPALPVPSLCSVGSHCTFHVKHHPFQEGSLTVRPQHRGLAANVWSPFCLPLLTSLFPLLHPYPTTLNCFFACLFLWMACELLDGEDSSIRLWYPLLRVFDMVIIGSQLGDIWCRNEWVNGWIKRWLDGWIGGWVDGWVGGWIKRFQADVKYFTFTISLMNFSSLR